MNISKHFVSLAVIPVVLLIACDDSTPTSGPRMDPTISVSASTLDFGALDIGFGWGVPMTITVTNTGSASLSVGSPTLTGDGRDEFELGDGGAFLVAAGATQNIVLRFDPAQTGARSASLDLMSNDPNMGNVTIALTGTGAVYQYRQVDREGIPTINTVFNHPPAFSKTAFNTAGPDQDLASYRGQFEVVLGAVANADPAGTTSLLLPDALPVNMSASPMAFPTLTGRRLADDAVDVALSVVVGVPTLQSDNVDANDKAFLAAFPYLAAPN